MNDTVCRNETAADLHACMQASNAAVAAMQAGPVEQLPAGGAASPAADGGAGLGVGATVAARGSALQPPTDMGDSPLAMLQHLVNDTRLTQTKAVEVLRVVREEVRLLKQRQAAVEQAHSQQQEQLAQQLQQLKSQLQQVDATTQQLAAKLMAEDKQLRSLIQQLQGDMASMRRSLQGLQTVGGVTSAALSDVWGGAPLTAQSTRCADAPPTPFQGPSQVVDVAGNGHGNGGVPQAPSMSDSTLRGALLGRGGERVPPPAPGQHGGPVQQYGVGLGGQRSEALPQQRAVEHNLQSELDSMLMSAFRNGEQRNNSTSLVAHRDTAGLMVLSGFDGGWSAAADTSTLVGSLVRGSSARVVPCFTPAVICSSHALAVCFVLAVVAVFLVGVWVFRLLWNACVGVTCHSSGDTGQQGSCNGQDQGANGVQHAGMGATGGGGGGGGGGGSGGVGHGSVGGLWGTAGGAGQQGGAGGGGAGGGGPPGGGGGGGDSGGGGSGGRYQPPGGRAGRILLAAGKL